MKIFYNANIYNAENPSATALAIENGRIIALCSDAEIHQTFPLATHTHNLNGLTLWPGLTDAHVHLKHLAESMAMVDCETATLKECLDRVEKAAKILPPDAWVRGHGWNHNRWEGGYGSADLLDKICGGRPAYLTAKSLHAGWANTKALQIAGLSASTPDPSGGEIQRDQNGNPTGILFEADAMHLVESRIPKATHTELITKFRQLIPELWRMGLVGVHDFDGLDCYQVLEALKQDGTLPFRVVKNIPFDDLDTFIQSGLRTYSGDDWLQIGWLKLFADGALGPQTAAMLAAYEESISTGTLLLSEDEIISIGKHAVEYGIALAIHAIGDRANRVVLNAFEKIRAFEQEHGFQHLPHRVEHVQIITPEDVSRFSKLDIIASVQPVHAPSDMAIADIKLGTRSADAYAYRTLHDANACLVFGSDAPVEPVNPFYGLHAAVTRRRLDGSPGINGWHPEQRLSLDQALRGFSHTPAQIANKGRDFGKIQTGYHADFILLEDDPFTIDSQEIWKIKPIATFIDGNCVYQSSGVAFDQSRLK